MKQILIACLIGMGLLLPTAKVKSSVDYSFFYKRVIDVGLEGYDLLATSDSETGTLVEVDVYQKSTGELVRNQSCSGYSCKVSLSGLPSGDYLVEVSTTLSYYQETVTL